MSKNKDHKQDVKQNAGLDQNGKPEKTMAQEGPQGQSTDVGRERGQPEPSEENPSPMADKIEAEQLAKMKENAKDNS